MPLASLLSGGIQPTGGQNVSSGAKGGTASGSSFGAFNYNAPSSLSMGHVLIGAGVGVVVVGFGLYFMRKKK